MIDERDVIRQEEIDFRKIVHRFFRGWPIIFYALGFFAFVALLLQLNFPAWYTAKTTLLVEKPKGLHDPGVMITQLPTFSRPDDYYYINQKVSINSYPYIYTAAKETGMQLGYFKKGLILNKYQFKETPIEVELDTTFMTFERHLTPYGTNFYVKIIDAASYELEADGEYPITEEPIEIEGIYGLGDWVSIDKTRFRITLRDPNTNPAITLNNDLIEDEFGFVINDLNAVALDYISTMLVEAEDVETTVFGVSVTGSVPEMQKAFLSNLTKAYIKDQMYQKTHAIDRAIVYLNDEIDRLKEELNYNELEMQNFKTENSITNLAREGTILVEEAMKLENDQVSYLVKQKYYEYLEKFLNESDNFATLISPQAFGIKDELLGKLTEDLVRMQFEMNEIERTGNRDNPIYRQLESKMQNNRETILSTVNGFIQSNRMMIDKIDERLADIDGTAKSLPKIQQEMLKMERMHRINEALYTSLTDKKAEAEITLTSITPDSRVIEPAFLTTIDPIFPKPIILIVAAILLGLVTGFGWILMKSVLNNKVDSPSDIHKYAYRLPLIGKVGHSNITTPADLVTYPQSMTSEEIGRLLYAMQLGISGDANVIGICSHGHQEGKSTLTSMLGTKAASRGYKSVCVDLNFRDPKLHELFKISNNYGVRDYLKGELNIQEISQSTAIPNLDMIGTGKIAADSFISDAQLSELFKSLASMYDYVFVDMAPFGKITDSFKIMAYTHQNIIVVRRKKTQFKDLEYINEMSINGMINNASIVVTDVFEEDFNLLLLNLGSDKYFINKKPGLAGRIKRVLVRV